MRIVISTAPSRIRPKAGDRRMLRGVEHVRVLERCSRTGAYIVNHGRPCFVWIPLADLPPHLSFMRDKPGRWVGPPKKEAACAA